MEADTGAMVRWTVMVVTVLAIIALVAIARGASPHRPKQIHGDVAAAVVHHGVAAARAGA